MLRFATTGVLSALLCYISAGTAHAQQPFTGQWLIAPPAGAGEAPSSTVRLRLKQKEEGISKPFRVTIERLEGLSQAQLSSDRTQVRFHLKRDAGTFILEGWAGDRRGSGSFDFSPAPGFAAELARRGIGPATPGEQFLLALYDIGLAYVDELDAQGYARPTVAGLVGAGVQGAGLEYLREMGALGHRFGTVGALADFRSHGVTPHFVQGLADVGYPSLSAREVLRLHNQGVRPSFVRDLAALGYSGLSVDQLEQLKVQGVTTKFIRQVNARGTRPRSVSELVRLRIAGRQR